MSSTCFEPEGLSSGRRLYIQGWYSVFYMLKLQQKASIRYISIKYLYFLNMYLKISNILHTSICVCVYTYCVCVCVCVVIAQGLVLEFSFVDMVEFVQRFKP